MPFTISAMTSVGAVSFSTRTALGALAKQAELSEAGFSPVEVMTSLGTKVSSAELAAIAEKDRNANWTS